MRLSVSQRRRFERLHPALRIEGHREIDAAAVAAQRFVEDDRAVARRAARPLPIGKAAVRAARRRGSCRNSRRPASADADDRARPAPARMARSATIDDCRSSFSVNACCVIAVGTTRTVPRMRLGIGTAISSMRIVSDLPSQERLLGPTVNEVRRAADGAARPLRHRPAIAALAIDRDIDGAMIERIGRALAPREGVVGREHAADEGDDGDAVLRRRRSARRHTTTHSRLARTSLDEVRSAIRLAAADRPDSAAIGTPGPGCVLPPARYRPGILVRAPGRWNEAVHPCELRPYSAPPVAGNSRLKSAGVVTRVASGCRWICRPHRSSTPNVRCAHCSTSAAS